VVRKFVVGGVLLEHLGAGDVLGGCCCHFQGCRGIYGSAMGNEQVVVVRNVVVMQQLSVRLKIDSISQASKVLQIAVACMPHSTLLVSYIRP
jgi:hypothetical protein